MLKIITFDVKQIGKTQWKFKEDFVFERDGKTFRGARKGWEIDGSSSPYLAQWYVKPSDNLKGAGAHDLGYRFHQIEVMTALGTYKWVTKSKAWFDDLYEQFAIEEDKQRKSKAWFVEKILSSFGLWSWWTAGCNRKCRICSQNAAGHCPYQEDFCKKGYEVV